ncbi:transaldolase [Criblamydia sequanensis]|uniref:Transaldolase n=1 Tax=Candidatus Criblamydia sequanensis CRIB-18 TaxID=1437425 RepID=A0A090D214_9BACT|nr:transaldolase [Criblamydia sequanensis]CDR33973.1 Transaldolase [Criblamydia sequanensis CRIB-18]
MNKLEQLREMTTIVVDTGNIDSIKRFTPTDATTNPSLILKASEQAEYKHLLDEAVNKAKSVSKERKALLNNILDQLFVNFGIEILKSIPGRVSTEVDARLSFDVEASISKAHHLISLYEKAKIPRERVLIKLASTWEGIVAAKTLEKEGIHCNMTLLFSLPQAIAASYSNVTLISPFVGRILDWHKKNTGKSSYAGYEDPGVISVKNIYNYYKKFDIKSQVMGASFRNADEILELAGCDLLTISPELLNELSQMEGEVPKKLDAEKAKLENIEKIEVNEETFRWLLNEDQMATEKLSDGIRKFAEDTVKLEKYLISSYNL